MILNVLHRQWFLFVSAELIINMPKITCQAMKEKSKRNKSL